MKIIAVFTFFSLFILFCGLSIRNWITWKTLHAPTMTCDAIVNVHKENQVLSLRLKYAFLGKEGVTTLSGTLFNDKIATAHISRHVFFNYKRVDNAIYFENKRINISLQDTAGEYGLKYLLPSFYTQQGAQTSFEIYAQKPGGYIFVKDFTPAFYCAEQ